MDDRKQKGGRLFADLRKLRYPRLVNQEERFDSARQAILRDTRDIRVEAPAHFEDEGFVLRAAIRRPESLDSVMKYVKRKKNVLNSLFEIVL